MATTQLANNATRVLSAIGTGQRVLGRLNERREAVSEAIEDGRKTANRIIDRTRENAEDLVYQVSRSIKRTPIRSVMMALAAGAVIGMLMSRSIRRS